MPNISDPQACYEELVRAIEDEGYRVLMSVDGTITLERSED